MGGVPVDSLKSAYLMIFADIDGDVDDFLDALYNGPQSPFSWEKGDEDSNNHAEFVRNLWGQCIGYPQETGSVFFRQYIHRCRIKGTLPYAAYDHSVDDVKQAKHTQEEFAAFVTRTQQLDANALHAAWKEFKKSYAAAQRAGPQAPY